MIEQAEGVVDISLADPHRRVLCAAIDLITCLVKDFDEDQVKYVTKFVPRLVTIIRSSSIYPSIQLRATMAVHLLIPNCADEEAVKSFLKDLMPVLLDLIEKGEREFLKEAKKTLKSLAVSFPVIFRGYFQKSVDSLKAFTSQSLPEEKFMDDLSFIFMGPLIHEYFSLLLEDIQPEALSQLCKLPQQVAGQLLSKIMPDLLLILENAEPITKEFKPEKAVLACDLLTKFADHFPKNFEPWASSICGTKVFHAELVKQIVDHIKQILFLSSTFANMKKRTQEKASSSLSRLVAETHKQELEELEEQIIQAGTCLMTMINTLKIEFLPHVFYLLPAIEALWGSHCPDNVKAVAISILNLLLSHNPQTRERYGDTYPMIVMDLCYSQSPQLQREAARGIGLCAIDTKLMPNFDASGSMDSLNFVIDSGRHSQERVMTYDVAILAFGNILKYRRHTIHNPQILPLRLKSLPLRDDFKEVEYGNAQLNLPLERYDGDALGHNDDNLSKAIQISKKILSKRDNLAASAPIGLIKGWLSKIEARP
ncbi:hypothetical protein K1719_026318 [Acacia pycnantha]|nr:hypothetical protein K1719_026318 [Acacia pycnantha]